MDIKEKAVFQAMKMLDAVGAQYVIVTEDGKTYGEIVAKKKRRSTEPSIFMPYKERTAALNPGESLFLDCTKENKEAMQLAAASFLAHTFGKGNYMTSRCEQGVEVLILADKRKTAPAAAPDSVVPFLQRKA